MLWIHIGMPKTGTTALQGFLHANAPLLAKHGIHYMTTGRDRGTGTARLISHNSIAMDMIRGWRDAPAGQSEAFRAELAAHDADHCLLSSEMFFGRDLAPLNDHVLPGLDAPLRVLVYLRRFDDFIEADYKQRAKNGKKTGRVADFVAQRLDRIESDPHYMNFAAEFERIRAALPGAEIVPRLYLRDELAGRNVITDCLSVLGVPPDEITLPDTAANRTLSRLASEALGMFGAKAGFDAKRRRRLGRALQSANDPRLFASGDVLTDAERARINDICEARNTEMRKAFFPERERLFPVATPKPDAPQRGHPDELAEFQYATAAILRLIAAGR